MTRREVEAVLNPCASWTTSAYRHLAFAIDMVMRYGVTVVAVAHLGLAKASGSTRTVWISPIDSDPALAVLAHEIGHVEDVTADAQRSRVVQAEDGEVFRESLEGELVAWRFAMARLGRARWSNAAQQEMVRSLTSYQRSLVVTVKQLEVIEAVVEEGRRLAEGVIQLRPSAPVDLTVLRRYPEGVKPWRV